MDNIKEVSFSNSYTEHLYGFAQYDRGQKLKITGIETDANTEVHFSLSESGGESPRVLPDSTGTETIVSVPDFVFCADRTYDYEAYAFVYYADVNVGKTERRIIMHIKSRPKPADFAPPSEPDLTQKVLQELGTKLTSPSTAQIGQIFRVQSITEDGNLVLEAVDMPSGGSGGAVDDVTINGESIVGENGVAEIPPASRNSLGVVSVSNGVSITAGGALTLDWAYEGNVESRAGTKVLRAQNIDYAVKCAMCDGKGTEWTADEQAMARARMGIGDWELITEVNLDTETARYILCSCDEYDKINIFLKRDANNTSLTGNIQVIIIDKSDNIVCELLSKPNTGYRDTLFELNCINGYAFGTYMASNNSYSFPAHISPAFYVGSGNRYCVNIPSPSTACDGLSKMIVIGRRK